MYVVERLINGNPTGKYFKRGNIRSQWDSSLVDRDDATVFRNTAGIKNCLGTMVRLEVPKKVNRWRTQRVKRVLDGTKWKIHEVSFHDIVR